MTIYPTNIAPSYPYGLPIPRFKTIVIGDSDEPKQRRRKRLYPLFDITLTYKVLNETKLTTLYDFFIARGGKYESFTFVDFMSRQWNSDSLNIGAGTGSQATWSLQAKETSSQIITLNGVLQTLTTDYTISTGGDGQDRITFVVIPPAGYNIEVSYIGKRYFYNCVFQDDMISFEVFTQRLLSTGITISQFSAGIPDYILLETGDNILFENNELMVEE